jgi:hypothetical protein
MLADDWRVKSSIWSVTSFNELTREAQAIDRENRFSLAHTHKLGHKKYNLEWCWRQYANRHLHAVNPRHLGWCALPYRQLRNPWPTLLL